MTSTIPAVLDASLIDADVRMLRSTLGVLTGDPVAFAGWLRTFDDEQRADTVARLSYWHPNGFAKLVLQAREDHKVRLHVWPAGDHRLGESNPHGHRWNFASTVLCGDGLLDVHFEESERGLSYLRHAYVNGTLTPVGDVSLAERRRREHRTHDIYTLDTSIVHTVQPLGTSLVATLVVQGPPRLETAPVYCAPDVRVDEPVADVTTVEVRELVRDVIAGVRAH